MVQYFGKHAVKSPKRRIGVSETNEESFGEHVTVADAARRVGCSGRKKSNTNGCADFFASPQTDKGGAPRVRV